MTDPPKVPHAVVGHQMTEDQRTALNAYLDAGVEFVLPGSVLTAALCNRAIDWFNEMRGH